MKHALPHLLLVAAVHCAVYYIDQYTEWDPRLTVEIAGAAEACVDAARNDDECGSGVDAILPFRYFAATAGIALVFRVNMCYHRWWQARTDLEQMSSYFFSAFMMAITFDSFTEEEYFRKAAAKKKAKFEGKKVRASVRMSVARMSQVIKPAEDGSDDSDDSNPSLELSSDSEEEENLSPELELCRALLEFRMRMMSCISLLHATHIFNLSCSQPAPDPVPLQRLPERWLDESQKKLFNKTSG